MILPLGLFCWVFLSFGSAEMQPQMIQDLPKDANVVFFHGPTDYQFDLIQELSDKDCIYLSEFSSAYKSQVRACPFEDLYLVNLPPVRKYYESIYDALAVARIQVFGLFILDPNAVEKTMATSSSSAIEFKMLESLFRGCFQPSNKVPVNYWNLVDIEDLSKEKLSSLHPQFQAQFKKLKAVVPEWNMYQFTSAINSLEGEKENWISKIRAQLGDSESMQPCHLKIGEYLLKTAEKKHQLLEQEEEALEAKKESYQVYINGRKDLQKSKLKSVYVYDSITMESLVQKYSTKSDKQQSKFLSDKQNIEQKYEKQASDYGLQYKEHLKRLRSSQKPPAVRLTDFNQSFPVIVLGGELKHKTIIQQLTGCEIRKDMQGIVGCIYHSSMGKVFIIDMPAITPTQKYASLQLVDRVVDRWNSGADTERREFGWLKAFLQQLDDAARPLQIAAVVNFQSSREQKFVLKTLFSTCFDRDRYFELKIQSRAEPTKLLKELIEEKIFEKEFQGPKCGTSFSHEAQKLQEKEKKAIENVEYWEDHIKFYEQVEHKLDAQLNKRWSMGSQEKKDRYERIISAISGAKKIANKYISLAKKEIEASKKLSKVSVFKQLTKQAPQQRDYSKKIAQKKEEKIKEAEKQDRLSIDKELFEILFERRKGFQETREILKKLEAQIERAQGFEEFILNCFHSIVSFFVE